MEARPVGSVVRVWKSRDTNEPGFELVGQIPPEDCVELDGEHGTFTLKMDHPIAKWLMQDENSRRAVMTVDFDNGRLRFQGSLRQWTINRCRCKNVLLEARWQDFRDIEDWFADPTEVKKWNDERIKVLNELIGGES